MPAYDIAVIGAGAFGAWTAWHLNRAGQSVLLLDAWGPGHSRSSSGGESRIIRMGYGADEIYTRMASRSLSLWQDLFQETGAPLFHRTGVLWIARRDNLRDELTWNTLNRAGVAAESLSFAEIRKRYPQIHLDHPDAFGIYEPHSGALLARRAVTAVVEAAVRAGVRYATGQALPPAGAGALASVCLASGEPIPARVFVFACGSWLPKLFPALLAERIYPTRQEVFFFAPPPGDPRFSAPDLPVWIDFTHPRGPYGLPDLEGRGFKLAFDQHGPPFDPDSGDRTVSPESVSEARAYLSQRFPDLRDAPVAEVRVCQYENTSNGDFLIDRHPRYENLWLAGGGSGHGFKHGPAVGEYVTSRILGGGAPEPRFSLAGKAQIQERTVY